MNVALSSVEQDTQIRAEGDAIFDELQQLRSEIDRSSTIPPLLGDGGNDIEGYNMELETLRPVSWHNSPWMYTECYLFRRLQTCFARRKSEFWQEYDIWAEQKLANTKMSGKVIFELVEWFLALRSRFIDPKNGTSPLLADHRIAIEDLLQISLWGNTADLLSLLAISPEELQSRQGFQARKHLKNNLVVDDTDQVVNLLEQVRAETHRDREIHIVVDNAGFELISDLVLVAYLLCGNFTDKIVLHGKKFPWYVSDATQNDFDTVLSSLSSPGAVFTDHGRLGESSSLPTFYSLIRSYLCSNPPRLTFTADPFWTTAHPFARLPTFAHNLYKSLQDADLVIFKGDLNYRKLIAGGRWPADTPFEVAIGPLKDMNLRILTLRTCKGDTCVGLRKGQVEEIDPAGKGEWTRNGQFGVISFFDGKPKEA